MASYTTVPIHWFSGETISDLQILINFIVHDVSSQDLVAYVTLSDRFYVSDSLIPQ